MQLGTMKAAVAILKAAGETVELEFPGTIDLQRGGRLYVFGDANEDFGGDAYASYQAYEMGGAPELLTTPLRSDHSDPAEVAKAVMDAVSAHQQQEPRFHVLNETDGILAHPEPMTRGECDDFIVSFRERFAAQGYYASCAGRIPVSELRLKRIPEDQL